MIHPEKGYDLNSNTSFKKTDPTGTLKLATGSILPGPTCSNIQYSVSGLASWMTYDGAQTITLTDLANAPASYTFTYTMTYNDGLEPTYKIDYSITVEFLTCDFTVPNNWMCCEGE